MTLPLDFEVRVRDDVRRLDGGRVLLGGSPLRAIRLSDRALDLVDGGRLRVADRTSGDLARRLLAANVADPVLDAHEVPLDELTVVIPVRDRPQPLDGALAGLRPGLRVLVVDDASLDRAAVAGVVARHGAELLPLDRNVGPAAARNAGLARVTTPYVAFVDSDVTVTSATLLRLARHFADPEVALVGPLVRGRSTSARPRWFERYDERASSLALGDVACVVRPGAAVGWLPSACVVARTDALGAGFSGEMRVGEDVDLVWRLVAAGLTVRYDPGEVADHETRTTVRGWLGRKLVYGTGGAPLAARHGDNTATAVLSPAMAVAAAALLLRRRWSVPVAAIAVLRGAWTLGRVLPHVPGRPAQSLRISGRGLGWALRQESALLLRHWWPATAAAAVASRPVRRAVVTALVVDTVVAARGARLRDLPATLAGRRLDDLAYGLGLWVGAARARSLRCVGIRVVSSGRGPAGGRGRRSAGTSARPTRRRG